MKWLSGNYGCPGQYDIYQRKSRFPGNLCSAARGLKYLYPQYNIIII